MTAATTTVQSKKEIFLAEWVKTTQSSLSAISAACVEFPSMVQAGSKNSFIDKYVTASQLPLKSMDARTQKIFNMMIDSINIEIDKPHPVKRMIQFVEKETSVPQFRKMFVEGVSYPHIVQLRDFLDGVDPAIINDLTPPEDIVNK